MLWNEYDLLILDLDGVLYIGDDPVVHAIESINQISEFVQICAATNNASRPAAVVAEHLRSLGLVIEDEQVFTSAEAAAEILCDLLPPRSPVLAVGGAGVTEALTAAGFQVVRSSKNHKENLDKVSEVVGVVQGHGTDNNWWDMNMAMQCIQNHAIWIATNPDLTVPIPGGFAPGNGAFVKMLSELTGVRPIIAGKPENSLFDRAALKYSSKRPLVVGDRLDTDIAGAVAAGFDSLLVETGVHKLADVTTNLPTYVVKDLRGLLEVDSERLRVNANV